MLIKKKKKKKKKYTIIVMLIWSIGSLQLSLRPGAYGVSIEKKLAFNSRLFLYRAPCTRI